MKRVFDKLKNSTILIGEKANRLPAFKKAYNYYRQGKQFLDIYHQFRAEDALIVHANTILDVQDLGGIKNKMVVFVNVHSGEYNLVLKHKSGALHKNRKLVWASFEMFGVAVSPHISKKLGLNMGKDGMFSYVGGGRAQNGFYHSSTSLVIYKNTPFLVVKFHTTYKDNLEIQEIGLFDKNYREKSKNISDQKSQEPIGFVVDQKKIHDKIWQLFDYNTYIIYANISPNVADGSSIWMSSMVDIIATNHKVILVLKENLRSDIIVSNIVNKHNLTIIQPSDYSDSVEINEQQALDVIRNIDFMHPYLRGVLVRGIVAANELVSDRIFKYRTISYLTDFYEMKEGVVFISDAQQKLVKNIALHSHLMLIQTIEIKKQVFSLLGYEHSNFAYLPPSLPDAIFDKKLKVVHKSTDAEIKIGYAGKIMPNWGMEELLSWVVNFNRKNDRKIKLFIAANKISAKGEERKPFVAKIKKLLAEAKAEHYTTLNREQCINLLKDMDYVWAFRPGYFEDFTLELSTKLLEAIAMNQKVICYPSKIHINELGSDYPFYVKDESDFCEVISSKRSFDSTHLINNLRDKHAVSNVAKRLSVYSPFNLMYDVENIGLICFSGHDFKFIDPYISYLKSRGFKVIRDIWEWGIATDLETSKNNYKKSSVIFCEWGLANAVYFSNNNTENKPLYIRVHLQEINERAKKFGKQINFGAVTKVIFVSNSVREEYIRLFSLPREKTIVIPNFVLDDEYGFSGGKKARAKVVTLGMVGIVPQRKRFDRAVNLLLALNEKGIDAELHIKGHRPENLEFMKGASRIKELDYYYDVYNQIKEKGLESKVIFSEWGNDVALWYKDIDFILSPSDFESFHYALADGVLSGSIPVVWNWSEASEIYQDSWIVSSDEQAVEYVMKHIGRNNEKLISKNRNFIIKRYGKDTVFHSLTKEIFG